MPERRGVSAAEKYAEVGDQRPRCECHGEEMLWKSDSRKKTEGHWQCAEKVRDYHRRYYEANREKRLESARRRYETNLDKARESSRLASAKLRTDPDYRRKHTLYMIDYHHRRKREKYSDLGLTLRNHDQEGCSGGDQPSS